MAEQNGNGKGDHPARRGRPRTSVRPLIPAREKERRAYDLWVRGATAAQIANTVAEDGRPMYGSIQAADSAINRAAAFMRPTEDLSALRAQSLAGMEAARLEMWQIIERSQDDDVRIRAAKVLERIDARIGALMGLDAAIKYEHSGPGGGPVQHEVRVAALIQRADNIRLLPTERLVGPVEAEEA